MPTAKAITKEEIETSDLMTNSFLKDRDIYISEPIDDEMVPIVIAQLKYLEKATGIFIFI
jgi:hypothetical protein